MDVCNFLLSADRNHSRVKYLGLQLIVSCLLLFAGFVEGKENGGLARVRLMNFEIPAQPLASALQAYGEATGEQILYESQSALGRRSVNVTGKFPADAALIRLLAGTGLQVHHTGVHAITISFPQSDAAEPSFASAPVKADLNLGTLSVHGTAESDDGSKLRNYSEIIKLDVQSALQENPSTRIGIYHFVANLWIDPDNRIARADLSQSTGDQERDDAVIAALQNFKLSARPPAGAPEPVRVAVSVKPYNE